MPAILYALRTLRNSPAFTSAALITLMLGIGANVIVFGVLNAILLQPLDVRDPQSLYQFRHQAWMKGRLLTTSYPAFQDYERRNTTFTGLIAINAYSSGRLDSGNSVTNVHGDEVTGNYFDVLGLQQPQLGRFFHSGDEHGPGSVPYLILSDALWRSAFNADTGIIGKKVDLNKHPFEIIGIAPEHFHGTERFAWPDYWLPMLNEAQTSGRDYLNSRAMINVTVIGRLKPGISQQQATENLNAIAAQLAHEYPKTDDASPLRLIHPGLFGDDGDVIRGFLWSVTALALLVLAAACANLASLFAARASDRSREFAIRVALGSSGRQILRQLLTEAFVLSLFGGAAGLVGADLLLGLLNRWPPAAEAHLAANVDARVYLAGLALTLVSALLFGVAPARQAWTSKPLHAMKGEASFTNLRRFAPRDLLLGLQITICMLLVTASFVAVRGMMHTLQTPLGFQPQGAMLVDLSDDLTVPQQQEIIENARAIPGVTEAGGVNRTPMTGGLHGVPVFRPGTTEFTLTNSALAPYVFQASPGYLDAAATHLLGGRDLSPHDTARTPHVAIVNQTFARKMWREASAIGQHFLLRGNLTEVVGVVEDGKYHDMTESPTPAIYIPFAQGEPGDLVLVIRSQRTPNEIAIALRRVLNRETDLPISVQTWQATLDDELLPARASTVALGAMGLLAAMLAVTGIFGMAAYSVSRRMKELGIRMALGASRTSIIKAAVGRPMILLASGSVVGLLAGIFASRLLGQIVYQANPHDPLVMCGAVLTMTLLGIFAAAIPASRALAVDASKLMHEE